MDITITTPALLFPAISLLLLAYTNRFIVIAQLIRTLHQQVQDTSNSIMHLQIVHLQKRILLIKHMQAWGVGAFISCTLSMGMLLVQWRMPGIIALGASLILLLISLVFSLIEIMISGTALRMQMKSLEK